LELVAADRELNMNKTVSLRLIYPASKDSRNHRWPEKTDLKNGRIKILAGEAQQPSPWSHLAGSTTSRLEQLLAAIDDPTTEAILCGRGGYGASDLLPLIPWSELLPKSPKWIIGFSDISALHAAFWTHLRWPGLHAPMPATSYWGAHPEQDVALMLTALTEADTTIRLPVEPLPGRDDQPPISGWLFGGCLSVLSNLIGTPYFPQHMHRAIVFWEDVDEPAGRVLRNVNQWLQSGMLKGVTAIVLGRFTRTTGTDLDWQALGNEISLRCQTPVFHSAQFGHCSPNLPLLIGAEARIANRQLLWNRSRDHGTFS
jgi:muramoyltetrapeptide carboxypeptidase